MEELSVSLEVAGKRHARELGRTMSRSSREGVKASGNLEPEKAVRASINRSIEAWAVYKGEVLLGVFGVSGLEGWAVPWLLTSEAAGKHPITFFKACKTIFGRLFDKYPRMMQMLYAKDAPLLSLMKRLGFTVELPEPWGVNGSMFCKAHVERKALIHG